MDSYYDCLKSPTKYEYEVEYFWISGVALVLVGFLGLIGNSLSIIVLSQKKFRKNVFYNLLIELACFDTLFILSYGIYAGYQSMACQDSYNSNVSHITYQLMNIGLSGSIYSTVVVSIERYIGICHPRVKYERSTWIYAITVVAISVGYNLPRLFEYQYKIENGRLISSKPSWAESESYVTYYIDLCEILIENVVPITLLSFTNGAIIRSMYKSSQMKINNEKNETQKNRATASKTLFLVVTVFMISHIPGFVNKFLYHLGCRGCSDEEEMEYRSSWNLIHPIGNLLLMINSSVNFLIYCAVGTKFRDELSRLLKCII